MPEDGKLKGKRIRALEDESISEKDVYTKPPNPA
jgi:hypothetical protein